MPTNFELPLSAKIIPSVFQIPISLLKLLVSILIILFGFIPLSLESKKYSFDGNLSLMFTTDQGFVQMWVLFLSAHNRCPIYNLSSLSFCCSVLFAWLELLLIVAHS